MSDPFEENFGPWIAEVKRILIEDYKWREQVVNDLDKSAWYDYFQNGYTPDAAVHEDLTGG